MGNGSALVKAEFADGTPIYLEADTVSAPSSTRAAVGANVKPNKIDKEFQNVGNAIKNIAKDVFAAIETIAPREAKVEFKLDVKFKAGELVAIFVNGEAAAGIKVELTWKPDK